MLKKLLASFLVAIFFLVSFAFPVKAAWYDQGPLEFSEKVFDTSNSDIFGERYTFAQVRWILWSIIFNAVPPDIFKVASTFEQTGFNSSDLVKMASSKEYSTLGSFFGNFYSSAPASGISWAKDTLQSFSPVKTAHAQSAGFGFDALAVFRPLWTISRNIAYALLTVLILFVAFAVMFRARINPQTVVTLQSSIPKIVSVMLLITFSYAIAGFLIDLMYLIFGFVVFAAQAFGGSNIASWQGASNYLSSFATGDIGTLFGFIIERFGAGTLDIFIGNGMALALGLLIIVVVLVAAVVLVGATALALPLLIPFVITFIFATIAFLFKFFIMMATTYLSFILNVIAGPLIILFEAVPGNKGATIGWIRSLVADILIFLVVGLIVFMTSILVATIIDFPGALWSPPYTGASKHFLAGLVSFGAIMLLSNVRKTVYQFMQKRELELGIRDFQGVGQQLNRGIQDIYDPGMRNRIGTELSTAGRTTGTWGTIKSLTSRLFP